MTSHIKQVLPVYGDGVCVLKTEEVTGWRKLHNEELHILYCSQNIIRMTTSMIMRWAGHVACKILVGKPKGKQCNL
jgi:hypothetical protein